MATQAAVDLFHNGEIDKPVCFPGDESQKPMDSLVAMLRDAGPHEARILQSMSTVITSQ